MGLMYGRVPPKLSEDSFGGTRPDIEPIMPRATGEYSIINIELKLIGSIRRTLNQTR